MMAGIRLVIQFQADTEEVAEAQVNRLNERSKHTIEEPGCIQFEVFRSARDPKKWALLERWASAEALDQHRKANPPVTPVAGVTRTREDYQYTGS